MRNNFKPETRELFDMGGYCDDWKTGEMMLIVYTILKSV